MMGQTSTLEGRVALVTGAGRGIGAATAIELAALGADVVVNDIDPDGAQRTASEVARLGRRALVAVEDVGSAAAVERLVTRIRCELGVADILVNNAGITRDALLRLLTEHDWDDVARVNVKGPFLVGQACARLMIDRGVGWGRIINLASLAWLGNVGQSNYAAAKAGVVALTRTWALELGKHGITVNAVAPGFIDTAMTRAVPTEIREKYRRKIPLRRIGEPADVARVVAFLATDAASYISGQCIPVDGALSVGIAGSWT
jgi:3-oxoacyl-[acyl-carrier protein] reductase